MTRALAMIIAVALAACEYPAAPDPGPLAARGEPCATVWDCEIGLTCLSARCATPPEDPDAGDPWDWGWDPEPPPPDAGVPDAAPPSD